MDIRHNGEKLTIDEVIDVTKDGNDYHFQCGFHTVTVTKPGEMPQPKGVSDGWLAVQQAKPVQASPVRLDPHHYKNGNNYLTVEQSVDRAYENILYDVWMGFSFSLIGDNGLLKKALTKLIENGEGRDRAYALAGIVKNGARDGRFKGAPLEMFFWGIVEGHIKEPEKVTY